MASGPSACPCGAAPPTRVENRVLMAIAPLTSRRGDDGAYGHVAGGAAKARRAAPQGAPAPAALAAAAVALGRSPGQHRAVRDGASGAHAGGARVGQRRAHDAEGAGVPRHALRGERACRRPGRPRPRPCPPFRMCSPPPPLPSARGPSRAPPSGAGAEGGGGRGAGGAGQAGSPGAGAGGGGADGDGGAGGGAGPLGGSPEGEVLRPRGCSAEGGAAVACAVVVREVGVVGGLRGGGSWSISALRSTPTRPTPRHDAPPPRPAPRRHDASPPPPPPRAVASGLDCGWRTRALGRRTWSDSTGRRRGRWSCLTRQTCVGAGLGELR